METISSTVSNNAERIEAERS